MSGDLQARLELLRKRADKGGEHQVVRADRYDVEAWENLTFDVPSLQDHIGELAVHRDYVKPAYADYFQHLFKAMPVHQEHAAMDPRYLANHKMLGEFAEQPRTRELRAMTQGDLYGTGMALLSMQDAIAKAFENLEPAARQAEQAAGKRQEASDALDQAEGLGQPGDGADGTQGPPDGRTMEEILAQAEAALDAADKADAKAEQIAASAGAPLAEAAGKAAREREEEQALCRSFGIEDGELKRMDFAERAALAERLRGNRMANFAKMLGAYKQIAFGERRKRVRPAQERIVDVEYGDDLSRLVPSELVNLANKATRKSFWRRYVTHELLVWAMDGVQVQGQGPVIVVCDESSSMNGRLGNATREAWSKATAFGLADNARSQGRDFVYVGFSSASQQWVARFEKGKWDYRQAIEFTEHFFSGGTSYEEPLAIALNICDEYAQAGKPRPDVVFITDDECAVKPEFEQVWNTTKEATQMRCFGVQMGMAVNPTGPLVRLCDNVRALTDLAPDRDAAELFRLI